MLNRKFCLSIVLILSGAACFGAAYATKWDNDWGQGSIPIEGQPQNVLHQMETIELSHAIQLAESEAGGKALGIHLRNMHGYLVYMAEIITPDNQTARVIIDAGDGRILFKEF